MTGMSELRDSEPSRGRKGSAGVVGLLEGQRPNMGGSAMKKLSTVMAAVVVAALFVVTMVRASAVGLGHDPKPSVGLGHVPASRAQGLMPEVVVTAEMPRIVMPTVVVYGYRHVAMNARVLNVN
jgi:hypothetical protein